MELGYLRQLGVPVVQGAGGGAKGSASTALATSSTRVLEAKGFAPDHIKRDGHPPWLQPIGGKDKGLVSYNSLTGAQEKFVPMEGNKIRWYTCGPTVYDVSHMGHARAYLTFDILRRIMVNHFGYDVTYQINITDIDDKIILRSRQNKLFDDFEQESEKMDMAALKKKVDSALALAGEKLEKKRPKAPEATATEKDKQEYAKLLPEFELKRGQHLELEKKVAEAAKGSRKDLLTAAREPLMGCLDKEKGHTVSDHAVFDGHARRFEDEYFADMDALGILRPDIKTRITDYMDGRVQNYIERLVNNGFAYESRGSVYFSIDDFNKRGHTYRKLVPAVCASAAEMEEGEGALAAEEAEKKNPNDFALWKKSKPGEPAWESPWGKGRPGWHIECSVMACDKQGEFLDIHAGGEDLRFPHHDNENAQSEAYLERPQWVNYFWHAGHLHIEGLKMSKSLKNFITIRQALEVHSARQMRLMFLMAPWDKGLNYSDQMVDMARYEERKFEHFFGSLRFFRRGAHSKGAMGERESKLLASLKSAEEAVDNAFKDNFNTIKVIDSVSKLIGEAAESYAALPEAVLEPVNKVAAFVAMTLKKVGVEDLDKVPPNEAAWVPALDAFASLRHEVRQLAKEKTPAETLVAVVKKHTPAVAKAEAAGLTECARIFQAFAADLTAAASAAGSGDVDAAVLRQRCDQVRDVDFVSLGVRLEDRLTDFVWMFEDSAVLKREAEEKAEKAAAAGRAKLENKLTQKRTELKVAEKASIVPAELFKSTGLYSDFDENGVPAKLASGEDVSAKKKKDLAKELEKHKKDHEKLSKQAGDGGVAAFVDKIRGEIVTIENQLK